MNNTFETTQYLDLHRSLIKYITETYAFNQIFIDNINYTITGDVVLDLSTFVKQETRTINSQFLSQFDADIYIKNTVSGKDLILMTLRKSFDNSFFEIKNYVSGDGLTTIGKGLLNVQIKKLGNKDDYLIYQFNVETKYHFD